MFYSHLPQIYGLQPFVVHATFQRYNNNGKVARFREAGAYVIDEPEYYKEGKFLVYENLVLEFMEAVETLTEGSLTLVRPFITYLY
jgi:arabinosyltransferase